MNLEQIFDEDDGLIYKDDNSIFIRGYCSVCGCELIAISKCLIYDSTIDKNDISYLTSRAWWNHIVKCPELKKTGE